MRPLHKMTEELENLCMAADDPPYKLNPDTLQEEYQTPEEWMELLKTNLESVAADAEEKILSLAAVTQNLKAQEDMVRRHLIQVSARRRGLEARRRKVLEYVNSCLASLPAPLQRVKNHLLTVSRRASNPAIDHEETDLMQVIVNAPDLVKLEPKLDAVEALRRAKTGEIPEGLALAGERFHVRISG